MGRFAVVDTHCHLDRYDDFDGVVARARAAGVEMMFVTFLPSDYLRLAPAMADAEGIDLGLGFHPMASRGFFPWQERIDIDAELELFAETVDDVPWIGEIGLDFSPDGAPHRELQERMLDTILSLDAVRERFLSIHLRYALRETVDALVAARVPRATIHGNGFTGDVADARYALDAGYYVSAVVPMLYDDAGREVVRSVPRDRLLLETDGPFGILDGEAMEPAGTALGVARVAELWGVSEEEVAEQLAANLREVRA